MGLIPKPKFRINARVIMFGGVAAALLAVAVWVIFQGSTYNPGLLAGCVSKRDPNPLYPIPGIVAWAVIAFLAGGVAARIRARFGGSR